MPTLSASSLARRRLAESLLHLLGGGVLFAGVVVLFAHLAERLFA